MRRTIVPIVLVAIGVAGIAGALVASGQQSEVQPRAYVPFVSRAETPPPTATATPTPSPTPRPQPYVGPVSSIYLASAGLSNYSDIEVRGTTYTNVGGVQREILQDPSAPSRIAHYPGLQGWLPPAPGFPAGHTIMAAHINYVGYGNGPFAHLTSANIGEALYLTMANGAEYAYTVKSVEIIPLASLDMDAIVYPPLDSSTERVTLISCGGDFVPNPSGVGGDYTSRVILIAERYVP